MAATFFSPLGNLLMAGPELSPSAALGEDDITTQQGMQGPPPWRSRGDAALIRQEMGSHSGSSVQESGLLGIPPPAKGKRYQLQPPEVG